MEQEISQISEKYFQHFVDSVPWRRSSEGKKSSQLGTIKVYLIKWHIKGYKNYPSVYMFFPPQVSKSRSFGNKTLWRKNRFKCCAYFKTACRGRLWLHRSLIFLSKLFPDEFRGSGIQVKLNKAWNSLWSLIESERGQASICSLANRTLTTPQ